MNFTDFSVSQLTGYAGITEFQFDSGSSDTTLYKAVWYFGDGSSSTSLRPIHIYHSPGSYKVTLLIYDKSAGLEDATWPISLEKVITVDIILNHSIHFSFVPPPAFAGHYNRYPFRVEITSPDTGDHYIDLGCQFSRSDQILETPNKWSFLRPQWRFLDLNGNVVQRLKTTDTVLRSNNQGVIDPNGSFVLGVSGYAEFYFVDDIYNSDLAAANLPYSTILATLDASASKDYLFQTDSAKFLPNFANSSAVASCPYIFLWRSPDVLRVTENGIRPHSNPRWSLSETPVIVNSTHSADFPEEWLDGNGTKTVNPDSYFVHSFPLTNKQPLNLYINLSGALADIHPSPSIEWTDESYYKTPGYYKGSIKPYKQEAISAPIEATLSFLVPSLSSNYYSPILWVSNPEANSVAVARHYHYPEFKSVLREKFTSSVQNLNVNSSGGAVLEGSHGIYSIIACNLPDYHAWLLDTDAQKLYRMSTFGEKICSIDINQLLINNSLAFDTSIQSTPLTMTMDGDKNIWITLKDTISTIKLDKYGNFLLAVTPFVSGSSLSSLNLPYPSQLSLYQEKLSWYDQSTEFSANTATDLKYLNALIQPSYVETDIENNVYVSYTNPFSSFIVKYDSTGYVLDIRSNIYRDNETPQEMVSDKNGNLWIASSKNLPPYNSYVEKRDSIGNLLESYTLSKDPENPQHIILNSLGSTSFGPYENINYLTVDLDQNLWFTHGYRNVSKITYHYTTTDSVTSVFYDVQTIEVFNDNSFVNQDDWALEGICADVTGKIYALNSVENQIYVINKDSLVIEDSFGLNPQGFVHYLDNNSKVARVYNKYNKSAVAQGDWSGFKWINKYASTALPEYSTEESFLSLSGSSKSLDFYTNNSHQTFFKINENYNLAQILKDHAFTPKMQESEELFDNFLPNIFGKYPFNPEDLGINLYEKISNFGLNHSDIDTCNIDQLYSNSSMVDLETDDFRLKYPPAIKRLMDLASINVCRLKGGKETGGLNFSTRNQNGFFNRGTPITSLSYTVTAGVPIVLGTKHNNKFRLIYTGPINRYAIYDLDTLADHLGIGTPWHSQYEFFTYVPSTEGDYLDGVIDWNNPQTTISFSNTGVDAWLGFEGIFETSFAYELYKGLNLLNT